MASPITHSTAAVHEREKVTTPSNGTSAWLTESELGRVGPDQPSAEERANAVEAREREERRVRLERARRSAEALRDENRKLPAKEDETLAEPVVASTTTEAVPSLKLAGRTKLEIDQATNFKPTGSLRLAEPTTTALVHVPAADDASVDLIDRVLALTLFLGGIAMVIGAFMTWTTGSVTETGWDRPDGVVVVIAGSVVAATAGLLFGGLWTTWARGLAIAASVIGLMGVGVAVVTTLTEMELTGIALGAGVYVVGAGTLAAIIASLAFRPNTH